jgi:hypothetical protein
MGWRSKNVMVTANAYQAIEDTGFSTHAPENMAIGDP